MKEFARSHGIWIGLAALLLVTGGLVIASAPAEKAATTEAQSLWFDDPATAVKGKPGGNACCNPADQPGTNGNPFCFEGASCCSDGSWSCNNPDGSPSCDLGQVCDGPCGSRGDSCTDGSDCCSGTCGKNGSCR